jgi:hypothetical protein
VARETTSASTMDSERAPTALSISPTHESSAGGYPSGSPKKSPIAGVKNDEFHSHWMQKKHVNAPGVESEPHGIGLF